MNKQKRDRWLKLIDKCMKQKYYGDSESCVFCNDTKTKKTDDNDCSKCICVVYVIAHERNFDEYDYACDDIMSKFRKENPELMKEPEECY